MHNNGRKVYVGAQKFVQMKFVLKTKISFKFAPSQRNGLLTKPTTAEEYQYYGLLQHRQ